MIGLFFVTQTGLTEGQNIYVSARSADQYRVSIESEKSELENIRNMIENATEQLARYEEAQEDGDFSEILDELANEVLMYRKFSGNQTVRGPGVIVTVDDGTRVLHEWEDINVLLVHDIDIMIIINDLKRNGAEAISVNGQRVVNGTEVSCSGYTIRINGQTFARPFVIRAIGDSARMSASLISIEGYGTLLSELGVLFNVTLVDDLVIHAFTGRIEHRFMSAVSLQQ